MYWVSFHAALVSLENNFPLSKTIGGWIAANQMVRANGSGFVVSEPMENNPIEDFLI